MKRPTPESRSGRARRDARSPTPSAGVTRAVRSSSTRPSARLTCTPSRHELVAYLAGEGISTRAIAPIVGASQATVTRDLAPTDSNESVAHPSTVTSLDGRQRPSTQPKPEPSRAAEAVETYGPSRSRTLRNVSESSRDPQGLSGVCLQ